MQASCWRRVGGERDARGCGTRGCGAASPRGRWRRPRRGRGRRPGRRSGRARSSRASLIAPGVERGDLGHVGVGGADEAGGVLRLGDVHRAAVDAVPLEPASGSRRSPRRPRRPAAGAGRGWPCRTRCWRPPRRGGPRRSSTRKDSEILSSCSTTSESANRPVEGHQVVGGDGSGDGDLHGATYPGIGVTVRGEPPTDRGPTPARRTDPTPAGTATAKGPTVAVGPFGVRCRSGGSAEGVAAGAASCRRWGCRS